MTLESSKSLGKKGEIIAAKYLARSGYDILETNFENKLGYKIGELDIVARDRGTGEIVFVEVKSRRMGSWGSENPELAITRSKYRKLVRIIGNYLRSKMLEEEPHRLDAVSVEFDTVNRKAKLKHLKYIYY